MQNVSVFVLSATSRSASPLTNFTFQAIVPKVNLKCLLNLLYSSKCEFFLIVGKSSKASTAI